MKHIKKRREPREFVAWKQQANDEWTPTYDNLSGKPRESLLKSLLGEQGYICCYCTRQVSESACHIEHFRPQQRYPELALEYNNLIASCQGDHDRTPPLHCGHHKGNRPARGSNDESLLISPLEADCERHFQYTGAGEILPADDYSCDPAELTISLLNLNEGLLQRQRKRAFDAVLGAIDISDFDAVEQEISIQSKRDARGWFGPFCAAIIYLLKWYQ